MLQPLFSEFQVLTAASTKMTASQNVAACSLVETDISQKFTASTITLMMEADEAPPKYWSPSTKLHSTSSQKTVVIFKPIICLE
jgi:hypothetical protein